MPRSSTTFTKERPKPGPGRPRLTPEQRRHKEAEKAAVTAITVDLKEEFRKMLPAAVRAVRSVLNNKKVSPQTKLRASEMVADRLYGRPAVAITGAAGGPLLVQFTDLLGAVDGNRREKL